MTHEFYLWMSYGMFAIAVVVELAIPAARREKALRMVEEERDLEAQD